LFRPVHQLTASPSPCIRNGATELRRTSNSTVTIHGRVQLSSTQTCSVQTKNATGVQFEVCTNSGLPIFVRDGHGRRCGREGDAGLNRPERERTRFDPHGECRINLSSEAIPNRKMRRTPDHPEQEGQQAGLALRRPPRSSPRRTGNLGARRIIVVQAHAER
jgi:hypothetical protein